MSRKRFSQEQITFALRQSESGLPVEDVCRKLGICQAIFFQWKTNYGAMGNEDIRRLRILEEENRKLKQLVADLSLDKKLLQDVLSKKL
jgi:putative transposase